MTQTSKLRQSTAMFGELLLNAYFDVERIVPVSVVQDAHSMLLGCSADDQ